jgi:hypothetical protein
MHSIAQDSAGTGIVLTVAVLFSLALYFVPTMIAVARKHHQLMPIIAVNLFLGWLVVGWVVALAMSLSARREPTVVQHFSTPIGSYPPQG